MFKKKAPKAPPTPLQKKLHEYGRLKWACRIVVAAMSAISIWGNQLHALPTPQAIIISSASPVLLFIAFELGSRIPQRKDAHWTYKMLVPIGMTCVAAINAWLSYWHQAAGFMAVTKDWQTSHLLPFGIDGLMLVASISLLNLNHLVRMLEAHGDANKVTTYRKPVEAEVAATPGKEPRLTKKQAIAALVAKNPMIEPAEVAKLVECTPNYAYTIMRSLKEATDTVEEEAPMASA